MPECERDEKIHTPTCAVHEVRLIERSALQVQPDFGGPSIDLRHFEGPASGQQWSESSYFPRS